MKKKIIYISSVVLLVLVAIFVFKSCSSDQSVDIQTVKVKKGAVSTEVTATGTLQALKTVEVGTQVSGVIDKIYVDFNSEVKKGQLLAELDRKTLLAELESSQAVLNKAKADLDYKQKSYERYKSLLGKGYVSQDDYDQVLYAYEESKSSFKTAQSSFEKAQTNLSYSTIYSPIDGIVLDRAVDEGQTVAASFSTPTLFTIANDLTQMQVEANIDEADIGQVKVGQRVVFTVDAFPDMNFSGEVSQIRLQPITTSNVVTYTVIINAPNPDKKLMPGLTADISIITEESVDVLTVSSKALRFNPDMAVMQAYMKSNSDSMQKPPMPPIGDMPAPKEGVAKTDENHVWVKNGSSIYPVPVKIGLNDESNVEIKSGLKLGDEVVVSMSQSSETKVESTESEGGSPFMPKPPKR